MGPLLKDSFERHLTDSLAQDQYTATQLGRYNSLAFAIRDQQIRRWPNTPHAYDKADAKRVYYLSLEFLLGRMLGNNLINLQRFDESAQAENILSSTSRQKKCAQRRAPAIAELKRVIDMIASDFFSAASRDFPADRQLALGRRWTGTRFWPTFKPTSTVNGKLPSLAYLDIEG